MSRSLFAVALVAIASSAMANPRDFAIDINPAFEGTNLWQGAPLLIDIENRGPDAVGAVVVGQDTTSTRYPVDLPRGAKKRLVIYPTANNYGGIPEMILETNQGDLQLPYQGRESYVYGGYNTIITMVSDTPGEMAFLKQSERSKQPGANVSYFDAYGKPENIPERPIGFTGAAAVVLGEGSERISDAAVKALRTYAMTGGTIVFIGGASATVLNDPRWADILPLRNFRTQTMSGSSLLSNFAGAPQNESFTVAAGTPILGAKVRSEGAIPLIAERPIGIGRIVVLAFNPFEEPFNRWDGRTRLFTNLIRNADYVRASGFLSQFQANSSEGYDYSYYGGPTPYSSSMDSGDNASDPFNVELPRPSKVFWTLAFFFLAVVPVNFFVLRKLKRGELAWITSPIISLVFAGVFLNQASELYSAKLSTATSGVLIVQQGAPEVVFAGRTQMFFPQGGSYDLKLQNVDQLGTGNQNNYYGGQESKTQIDPVDVGTITVPNLRAANLAFEEISYRQLMEPKQYVKVERISSNSQSVKLRITNASSLSMKTVTVAASGVRQDLTGLEPGQSKEVEVSKKIQQVDKDSDVLTMLTRSYKSVIVIATVEGLRPGPQIGNQVAARSSVRLVYFSNGDALGGAK